MQHSLTFSLSTIWVYGTAQNVRPKCPVNHISTLTRHPRFSPRQCLRRLDHPIVFIIFATFSKWTASADEIELSKTMQTTFANFVKDPTTAPAHNWPAYSANASVPTLAKLAYNGNVEPGNLVDPVDPSTTVSVGNIYAKRGLFIGARFVNRTERARNGTNSWTSAPEIYPSFVHIPQN